MNEILEGIRAIKMHCWEYTFANLVETVRKYAMYFLFLEPIYAYSSCNRCGARAYFTYGENDLG